MKKKQVMNLKANSEVEDMSQTGMIPGMEELFSLLKISEIHKSGEYDRIMVDCAPTGETLSLSCESSFPQE